MIAELAYELCHLQGDKKRNKKNPHKIKKKIAIRNIIPSSFGHGVMNCNEEMKIMMIEIISGIMKGQSQDAIMRDINCDL